MDKHDLYEVAVQDPPRIVPFLRALHGGDPRILGEDFCGTAAISREWVRAIAGGRAIAVDCDGSVLARARGIDAVEVVEGDVCTSPDPERHAVDVLFAGNFSIGELHTRARLCAYFSRARARLKERGVLAIDVYGGASAFSVGSMQRDRFTADGARVRSTWEQRSVDAATGFVVNALHFRLERDGIVLVDMPDAFVYRWRLWSLPELGDALSEAGFRAWNAYDEIPSLPRVGTVREPLEPCNKLGASFVVCIAAR